MSRLEFYAVIDPRPAVFRCSSDMTAAGGCLMMKSNAIRALHRAALLRPKAFGLAFLAAVVLVVLATVFWPGGAPLGIPVVVGAVAALAIGVLVPWIRMRRQPFLRTVEDVERTLRLPVVARYSPSRPEDW
jgi:hypothetical protein